MTAVPRTQNSYSDRSCAVAGPRLWNNFPPSLWCESSYEQFKRQLNTLLFGQWQHGALTVRYIALFHSDRNGPVGLVNIVNGSVGTVTSRHHTGHRSRPAIVTSHNGRHLVYYTKFMTWTAGRAFLDLVLCWMFFSVFSSFSFASLTEFCCRHFCNNRLKKNLSPR